MTTQTLNISLPQELVKKIAAAKVEFASRSDFIRQALVGKLRVSEAREQSDAWSLLESLSDEIAGNAEKLGYSTDEDFVRVVKEIRAERASRQAPRS